MLFSSQDPRTGEKVDKELCVTRKGATSAQKGQYGVIPGSMGVGSFITKGKGDPQAWNSCSHGAGRAMSRTKARNTILQVSCFQSIDTEVLTIHAGWLTCSNKRQYALV